MRNLLYYCDQESWIHRFLKQTVKFLTHKLSFFEDFNWLRSYSFKLYILGYIHIDMVEDWVCKFPDDILSVIKVILYYISELEPKRKYD